jgi:two-component system, NarL family, sensor kinase
MRKRDDGRAPHARIVTWFALTSLIVSVVIGAFITTFRSRDVRVREERAAASRAELVANEAIGPVLTATDLAGPVTGVRYAKIESAVRTTLLADPGILRVKLWGADGMVLFSNDRDEVGTRPAMEDDLREALRGELQSDVSDLTAAENVGERSLGSRLFETYVPFRIGMSGPVVGVIEVYQDYSVIQAEIDRLTRTLSISLGVGLLALYVVMLPLMSGITRTLRRQNHQLHEQAAQLSDLLEREQDTVAELRESRPDEERLRRGDVA